MRVNDIQPVRFYFTTITEKYDGYEFGSPFFFTCTANQSPAFRVLRKISTLRGTGAERYEHSVRPAYSFPNCSIVSASDPVEITAAEYQVLSKFL